jgi:hypothetical protein
MSPKISRAGRQLLLRQDGVVARQQSRELGLSTDEMRHRVKYADWQRLHHGIYATFSGDVSRSAQLQAALLRAGPGAVFSYRTAAELYGLMKEPWPVIHLTVPAASHPGRHAGIPGLVIHRSRILDATRHPTLMPPRTRVEDTVLDLVATAASFDDGYEWICKAIGNRLTTADRVRQALDSRSRFPGRREMQQALGDAGHGALSNLELRYLRGVERRHKLPTAIRQAPLRTGNRTIYLDNLYPDYLVCVELDGIAAHPASAQWADKRRDRANLAAAKIVTMRFGHADLHTPQAQCRTAAEVAGALRSRGPWVATACEYSGCPV